MANDIGSVTGINGTSTGINNQGGNGCEKPSAAGNANPGGTKPARVPDSKVPMPK